MSTETAKKIYTYSICGRNSAHRFSVSNCENIQPEIEEEIKQYITPIVKRVVFPRSVGAPRFKFYPRNLNDYLDAQDVNLLAVYVEAILMSQELGAQVECGFHVEYVITKNRQP